MAGDKEQLTQREMIEAIYKTVPTLTEISVFMADQKKKNERFEQAAELVLGNGKPGLCENVRTLTRQMGAFIWAVSIIAAGVLSWATGWIDKLFTK